jgi:hypothetical protein
MEHQIKGYESEWKEWSNYVLITLEKLGEAIENYNKDNITLRSDMINRLIELKEQLYEELGKCSSNKTERWDKIVKEVENLISQVSDRTRKLEGVDLDSVIETAIDKKFVVFNEKTISPIKIKLAVLCIIFGAVGGLALHLIPVIFKYATSG